MGYVSKTANLIYDSNFSAIIFPAADNGAPPLYSFYLALLWTVFGKSLWICHIAVLPFVLGMAVQFYRLAGRYLRTEFITFACLLLLIAPAIITQICFAGYDILLIFLVLSGLNSIIANKKLMLAVSVLLLPLVVGRGFTFLLFLLLADIYFNKKEYSSPGGLTKKILPFIPAVLLFAAWLGYHHSITGWYMVSQGQWESLGRVNNFEGILRTLVYVAWKICDFGMIILVAPVFFFLIKTAGNKGSKSREIFALVVISVLCYLVFFLPFSIPVSHRYFMTTAVFIIIGFVYFLQSLRSKNLRIIFSAAAVLGLLTGHFWIYPERFGNGWDASLKSLPYFGLKENLDSYITSAGINPADVGADFPMNFDNYDCSPGAAHFGFTDIDAKPFAQHKYIVYSNICNTFTPAEMDSLSTKWTVIADFRSVQVYIKLYSRSGDGK